MRPAGARYLKPDNETGRQLVRAIELDKAGEHERAAVLYRQILDCEPQHAYASHLLGAHALRLGQHDEAVRLIGAAVRRRPEEPLFHYYLGHAYAALRQWPGAVRAYRAVARLVPRHADAHYRLGLALKQSGDVLAAVAAFDRAMQLDGASPGAGLQLAQMLRDGGELDRATEILYQLLRQFPAVPEIYRHTGGALMAGDRYREAQEIYRRLFEMQRGTGWQVTPFGAASARAGAKLPQGDIQASPFFFQNLVGHIRYLVGQGRIDPGFLKLADTYQDILDRNRDLVDDYGLIRLSGAEADRVRPFLYRALHYADSAPVVGAAVNSALDFGAIEDAYLASSGPMTVIDGFLGQPALKSLRDFLLESTIFYRVSHNTYIASYADEGFSCSVLYQIAAELKQLFPRVLGDKELRNMWVYRQPPQGTGVRPHSDQAAVTFNFWITPDASNLDSGHGGLVMYDRQQPLDWDWYRTNADKDNPEVLKRLMDYLAGANTTTIPYRENRAVMFHSNLFHCSDRFRFREGYEHSRMNVTLLFGDHPASPPGVAS
jgi:tetratricopeptide (TPR) repeat protein